MELTAIILTFHSAALINSAFLGVGIFFAAWIVLRRRAHGFWLAGVVGVAWFLIALFGLHIWFGIGVGSVEIVSYLSSGVP